jgi:hypothetical protein
MDAASGIRKKRRWRLAAWLAGGLLALATAGVVLMFIFWPFRYRMVHPLLEKEFHSRVQVERYYRTYFPHPGFVADGVTFWRNGHPGEPPLAKMDHLHVVGTWTGLLFTPHTLYQIWLRGVRVRIVLKGEGKPWETSGQSAETAGEQRKEPEQSKLHIETIVANGATLDILRHGTAPLQLVFETLQIHNVHAGEPMTFFTRAWLPQLNAAISANGTLGPLRPGHYAEVPVRGSFSLSGFDLKRVSQLQGIASASGRYSGPVDQIAVRGKLSIPDFRVEDAHVERLDAAYSVGVKVPHREVDVESAEVKMAGSTIAANATIGGDPKVARVKFTTEDGNLERLLEVVEKETPSVAGKVSFSAQAEFGNGAEPFLRRLGLSGQIAMHDVTFVQNGAQKKMDAFSARVRKQDQGKAAMVNAAASAEMTFRNGMAYFRDVRVTVPGATAQLAGTFNLLNTRVNLRGKAAMQQSLSKDVGGWKSLLLAPLNPFFKHGKAGAVVPIAVTGTARNPKIGQNLLHSK